MLWSFKLIQEIDKQGAKNNRTIHCLLQVHIAEEETKFGLDEAELAEVMQQLSSRPLPNVAVRGLMGMASFTDNPATLSNEFRTLKRLFEKCSHSIPTQDHPFNILSMGMSSDYHIALEEGSTMVRIGSLLFGERQ